MHQSRRQTRAISKKVIPLYQACEWGQQGGLARAVGSSRIYSFGGCQMANSSLHKHTLLQFSFAGILALFFGLAANPIYAQLAGNGAIAGTVTDSSGAVVPNA